MPQNQSTAGTEKDLPLFVEPDTETGEPVIQIAKLPDGLFDRILALDEGAGFTPEWYRMHNKALSVKFNRIEAAEARVTRK